MEVFAGEKEVVVFLKHHEQTPQSVVAIPSLIAHSDRQVGDYASQITMSSKVPSGKGVVSRASMETSPRIMELWLTKIVFSI